jgi:hypothetical protein
MAGLQTIGRLLKHYPSPSVVLRVTFRFWSTFEFFVPLGREEEKHGNPEVNSHARQTIRFGPVHRFKSSANEKDELIAFDTSEVGSILFPIPELPGLHVGPTDQNVGCVLARRADISTGLSWRVSELSWILI